MDTTWDVIIIGGGIAGLETCRKILTTRPKARVCVLEKYNYIGGRMVSFREGKVRWEIGAGRVCQSHPMVRKLVADMGCNLAPIGADVGFTEGAGCVVENIFAPKLLSALETLSTTDLANNTLLDLTSRIWGEVAAERFWIQYPYVSEVRTLRADLALVAFKKEMAGNAGFSVCVEGFGEVARRLGKFLRGMGARIYLGHEVLGVGEGEVRCRHDGQVVAHKAKKIIAAVHSEGLKRVRGFAGWDLLRKVAMRPLVRIYAVFPLVDDRPWFAGLGKIVTSTITRYFIPINEKIGSAMISYTDGKDAQRFLALGDEGKGQVAVNEVVADLRRLFPDRVVPEPLMWRVHGWTDGCSYWLPGEYDPLAESRAAHTSHGIPGVYVVGESFCMRQAWIEGALEHVEQLWRLYGREIIHDKPVRGDRHEH
jgi:hypothetical protein